MAHIEARRINSMSFINGLYIELSCALCLEVKGQSTKVVSKFIQAFGKENHLYVALASQTSFSLHACQWTQY